MTAERTRGTRNTYTGHTTITCDFRQPNGDGCPFSTPMKGDTAAGIRKVGKELGWSHARGKDYCPEHAHMRPTSLVALDWRQVKKNG